jgi:HD superfamily phosphohydrolase
MSKVFRDHVHGYIELPRLCIRIIDTPEFQRLRRLKQLGVACFVFPNATHTRFEHSLGVAHLAGRLARNLQIKQPELKVTDADVLKLQVAGLIHDVGHGVFSHTYERANPEFNHEQHGVVVWKRLVKRLCLSSELESFVEGCLDEGKRIQNDKGWMYNLIHHPDGALDVDRLDYCKRDAQVASVSIDFDLDRILTNWRIDPDGVSSFPQKLAGDILAPSSCSIYAV